MTKYMLIDALHPEETRLVITEDGMIEEFDFVTQTKTQIKSNLYLAKITRVEPSLQAAFVEYGGDKQGFLPFSEIHPDYYQIPMADRARILEEERRAEEEAEARANEYDDEDEDSDDNIEQADEASAEDGDSRGKSRRRSRRGRRRFRGDKDRSAQTNDGSEDATGESSHPQDSTDATEVLELTDYAEPTAAPVDMSHAQNSQEIITEAAPEQPAPIKTPAKRRSSKTAVATDVPASAETVESSETTDEGDAPKPARRGRRPSKPRTAEMSADGLVTSSDVLEDDDLSDDSDDNSTRESSTARTRHHADDAQTEEGYDDRSDSDEDNDDDTENDGEAQGNNEDSSDAARTRSRRRSRRGRGRGRDRNRNETSEEGNDQPRNASADEDEEGSEEDDIETISGEEADETHSANHLSFRRRYKIQEVVKRGQIVLVQVIKEERGNKGVSLTTYISLPGRYCVLMPNSPKGGGISRKIARGEDRKRLRAIAAELRESSGLSAIIRTAGIDRTKEEIQRDYEYLVKLWNQIRDSTLSSTAPALVYEEGDIIKRSIRDYYNADIDNVIVQGDEAFQNARDFMKLIMPSHANRVKPYREEMPIFSAYDVEPQLQAMHKPTARLKSGGYIVIDPTEALISIDVNSGRSTTERNVEETALKTNLEAAAQIARQLRLRDLGGLVVIDFIDMYHSKHRRMVERAFKDALKKDRAKIQVGHISPFGLLELSRQRLRPSISETTSTACHHCNGSGRIRSRESLGIEIIRELEKEASTGQYAELNVTVTIDQALHLLNFARSYLSKIELSHLIKISVRTDNNIPTGTYTVEKVKLSPQARQDRDREKERERERERPRHPQHQQRSHVQQDTPRRDDSTFIGDAESSEVESYSEQDGTGDSSAERSSRRRRGSRGGRRRRFDREHQQEARDATLETTAYSQEDGEVHHDAEPSEENNAYAYGPQPEVKTIAAELVTETTSQPKAIALDTSRIDAHASGPVAVAPVIDALPSTPTVPVIEEPAPAIIIDEAPKENKSTRSGWWRRIVE